MSSSNGSDEMNVTVVGAGLTGSMIAIILAKKGYRVNVYERREDFRVVSTTTENEQTKSVFGNTKLSSKRSINLALSYRGQMALKLVQLHDKVMEFAIPMRERYIHLATGNCVGQPYGNEEQAIYSVSREDLNRLLLNEAERTGVKFFFGRKLKRVNGDGVATIQLKDGKEEIIKSRLVIGADGAYSTVRTSMSRISRQNFSQVFISHGYKELTIPPKEDGSFAMDVVNALHIWPRKEFMMIALPNPDKSFTCTLFAPYSGEGGFDSIQSNEQIMNHFNRYFQDAVPLMPDLVKEYKENPTGSLATIRVDPWNIKDKILLIDAAHAVVPFYGQGMNAGFEDCLFFSEILDQCNDDLEKAVPIFATSRRPAADALADLSFQNYVEMRDHTASLSFRLKKKVEAILHSIVPNTWIPLYTMVAFTRIPYHESIVRAKRQDAILSWTGKVAITAAIVGTASVIYRSAFARRC